MVNLDKWEEINYEDVRAGDKIRVITTQGSVISDTKGVAFAFFSYRGWISQDDVTLLSSPYRFKPIGGGYRTIYRRKHKVTAFTFPGRFGEVISGVGRVSGERSGFVHIGRGRYLREGTNVEANVQHLVTYYRDFKLVREGVTK